MLTRLHLQNFTVFADATFEFSPGLNVLVGTNGTGKSHVLKVGYAVEKSLKEGINWKSPNTSEGAMMQQFGVMNYLLRLFLTDLGDLNHRGIPQCHATVEAHFANASAPLRFELGVKNELDFGNRVYPLSLPDAKQVKQAENPVFIPAKEVLSFYKGFVSWYVKREVPFDLTYYDLIIHLGSLLLREAGIGAQVQTQLAALEKAMGGTIKIEGEQIDFIPTGSTESLPINLYAEGLRKFGTLWQLLRNGSLTPETTLFWDEPEANLNPALLRKLAAVLAALARQGFQIILATHSLFLLKELHILSRDKQEKLLPIRYFGLSAGPDGATQVDVADELPMLPTIAALDAEVQQSGEYLTLANDDDDYAD